MTEEDLMNMIRDALNKSFAEEDLQGSATSYGDNVGLLIAIEGDPLRYLELTWPKLDLA